MVIDTETTGLPIMKNFNVFYDASLLEYYEKSRLIELGYVIFSGENKKISEYDNIIHSTEFTINNDDIHGITNVMASEKGKKIDDVLEQFNKDLDSVELIVGHNIMFDISIILSVCYRYKKSSLIDKLRAKPFVCTMRAASKMFGRFINLQTLYRSLHNKYIVQTHRALDDANMCADCYLALFKKCSEKDK